MWISSREWAGRRRLAALTALSCLVAGAGTSRAAGPVAGSVTAERLKFPSGPNSVRGLADEPEVDPFFAQVTYEVPVDLPVGPGQFGPALSLSYSGALGNGPLGIGWSLPSVRVQRSLRLGVPRFDDTDELELVGAASGRLASIGGGEYRIEGRGQTVRVRRVGAGFEVDDGEGITYRLGQSPSARHESAAGGSMRTAAWLVEEQRNLAGERIRYEYDHDQGQVYLSRIVWGPDDAFAADLVHEPRGDRVTSYREGFRVVTARRVSEIQVQAAGAERRAYQLRYDERFPVSRLAGIDSTGLAGAGAWPSLTFDYAAAAAPAVAPVPGVQTWRLNVSGITLVDLDGDGAAELAQIADGGHSFRTNQNGSFGAAQQLPGNTQSIDELQLQDIDGDARAELLLDTGSGWAVWKSNGRRWVPQTGLPGGTWPGTQGLALRQPDDTRFADLDGDSLADAIRWDNDDLKFHRATPTGFLAAQEVGRIAGALLPSEFGRFQDTHGDGLDDYVDLQIDRLDVYRGRGDGTFEPAIAINYPFPGGRPDPEDLHLADLDRDGLMDLVRVDLGTVRWFRGLADGTFAQTAVTVPSPEPLTADVVVAITDINGNGSQDVVWSSPSGMWSMDIAGPTTAGILVRTRNGLGMDISFVYRSSHALSVDARLASDAWLHEVPISMPVPVEKKTSLGPGETVRVVHYAVRDAFWDPVERRFAGFLGTIVTTWGATPAETSSVQRRYHSGASPNWVLRGQVLTEQVRDGTGRRLSLTVNVWSTRAVAGLPNVPLLRRAVLDETRTRHEDTTPIRETRTTFEHDVLGRVTRSVEHGRLDMGEDGAIRETVYGDDAVTWVRDRVCEEKLFESDGTTLVSHVQHLFGDEGQVHPLCTVGKGWPRERRAWLATESRFVTQSAASYDGHGNPIALTDEGVTRQISYDPDGLYPVGETVELEEGNELTWAMTWDPALGVATGFGTPDGNELTASYDDLGRLVGVALGDDTPHRVMQFDWSEPSPRTVIWEFDGARAELTPWTGAWTPAAKWRQSVEIANGKGEVRYRAIRSAQDQWIISDYQERDPNSRVVFHGRPVYAAQLEHAQRPAGLVGDQLRYDPLGRLIEQRLATGTARTFSYTAFERTMQEADLAPVHSVLDGHGRIVATERELAGGTRETADARYDAADRLIEIRLQGGLAVHAFEYDTLGRLIHADDPDIGPRDLAYDDGNRLISATNGEGQTTSYGYDAAGRLIEERGDDGTAFVYHYDSAHPVEAGDNVRGRLAWVEEPTGYAALGYDPLGRAARSVRVIDGVRLEETTDHSPSGLVLGRAYDDGFSIEFAHDPAGRLIAAGPYWTLEEQDAAGGILRERYGNGVTQRTQRDPVGLPTAITVARADGTPLYEVEIGRSDWLAVETVTDHDGRGLDHTAAFGYDLFGRLTSATFGQGSGTHQFAYTYDSLQNMATRQSVGPRALHLLAGEYRYGEGGRGPRQLTSIQPPDGPAVAFDYDGAGRLRLQGGLTLEYDGLDQLVRVQGLPGGGQVQYAYGHGGQRVKSFAPDSAITYWFSEDTSERDGVRERVVSIGDRAVARVTGIDAGAVAAPSATPGAGVLPSSAIATALIGLFALALLTLAGSRPARRAAAAAAVLAIAQLSCVTFEGGATRQPVWLTTEVVYIHAGVSVGPTLFTRHDQTIAAERRFEPFGAPIDALVETESGPVLGDVDFATIDHNSLAKRSDPATGWSYHGARWVAPETARWLTPDPPVKAPDATFVERPWALHPYQYVEQSPIDFWDPDGERPVRRANPWQNARRDSWRNGRRRYSPGTYGQAERGAEIRGAQVRAVMARMLRARELRQDGLRERAGRARSGRPEDGLQDLALLRQQLGLPDGVGTLVRLDLGPYSFYGINAHGQLFTLRANAYTRTHAEGDAFQQAANAGVRGVRHARLFTDRPLCGGCGRSGGVKSLARQLGINYVEVTTPQGSHTIPVSFRPLER
jgi:RHS repeat-associated protein